MKRNKAGIDGQKTLTRTPLSSHRNSNFKILLEFWIFNFWSWNSSPCPFDSFSLCLSLNHVSGQGLNHFFISRFLFFSILNKFERKKELDTHWEYICVSRRESKVKTLWRPCMTRSICTYPKSKHAFNNCINELNCILVGFKFFCLKNLNFEVLTLPSESKLSRKIENTRSRGPQIRKNFDLKFILKYFFLNRILDFRPIFVDQNLNQAI